jgi:hypothetical protein
MKSFAWGGAAALLAALCVSSPLRAQSTQIFLGGGVGVPLGTYDDLVKLGLQGTLGVSFQPRGLPVAIQVDGSYARFNDETPFDIWSQLIYGTASARYPFATAPGTRFQPYLIGGLGAYNNKSTGDDAIEGSSTDLGINLGAGFDFRAGATRLFLEARWHNVFLAGDNLKFLPLTLGIRFGG